MRCERALLLFVLALCASSCRKHVRTAKPPVVGDSETGIASWYGYPYHGRRAANGEIYDMEKMTAAHRTLPFNTWVRVKNLTNDKTVDVRITDRGPFVDNRIIDLSHAAAQVIDLIGPGVARVQLLIITPPAPEQLPTQEIYAVQVGAFQDRSRAERIRADMETRYGSARIVERPAKTVLYRVLVGNAASMEEASGLASRLEAEGFSGFVVRVDTPETTLN